MEKIETADALAMTGVSRVAWNDALARGYYTEAPETTPGVPRYFDRDDMVALFVLDHWTRLGPGGKPDMAARVASAVRKELRKGGENLRFLNVVATANGTPRRVVSTDPGDDLIRHEIPVAKLRREIERLARERLGA